MRFAFTEQQTEFRDAVRQFLDNECTPADLRAAYDEAQGTDSRDTTPIGSSGTSGAPLAPPTVRTTRWKALAEMGVVGLTVPEAHGGLGLSELDLVLLLEEAGRAALPEPLLETTALAAPLLAGSGGAAGPGEVARHWLDQIASGNAAAAIGTTSIGTTPTGTAPISSSGMPALAGAYGADVYILEHGGGDNGPEIHVVTADAVQVTPVGSLDPTRRLGTVTWEPSSATVLVAGDDADRALDQLATRAAVSTAAELVGLADRMIAIAAEYAKDRTQFGKPIGSFQAVKHLLAGAQVKLEFARPVTYGAAWALAEGEPDAGRAASVAKAYASDAAAEAARVSLQVHGAIGYTWECDLHLFLKRAWALASSWGDAAQHRSNVLASVVAERGHTTPTERHHA